MTARADNFVAEDYSTNVTLVERRRPLPALLPAIPAISSFFTAATIGKGIVAGSVSFSLARTLNFLEIGETRDSYTDPSNGCYIQYEKMDCKASCPGGWDQIDSVDHGCCRNFWDCGGNRKICARRKCPTEDGYYIQGGARGSWGGKCRCPGGQEFLVGDTLRNVASIACYGGEQTATYRKGGDWSHMAVRCNGCEQVHIGSSQSKTKTKTLSKDYDSCSRFPSNWLNFDWTDRFAVSLEGRQLTVTRTNGKTWGMNLKLYCCVHEHESDEDDEDDEEPAPSPADFHTTSTWVEGDCSDEHGDLEWATAQCDATPSCTYIHDFNCDRENYRFCTGGYPGENTNGEHCVRPADPTSTTATPTEESFTCPAGYYAIPNNLDGQGKAWEAVDTTRSLAECSSACNARGGCTGFEYAVRTTSQGKVGSCGTYTGGKGNVRANEGRLDADSVWRSCLVTSACHDVQPPSDWANPTCAMQLANTNNCAKRRAGTKTDGYCAKTCGLCDTASGSGKAAKSGEKGASAGAPVAAEASEPKPSFSVPVEALVAIAAVCIIGLVLALAYCYLSKRVKFTKSPAGTASSARKGYSKAEAEDNVTGECKSDAEGQELVELGVRPETPEDTHNAGTSVPY